MTTLARYVFATLAMNAKVHSLLDAKRGPAPELLELKQEFHALERLYAGMKRRSLEETVAGRLDRVFDGIREKLREKGV